MLNKLSAVRVVLFCCIFLPALSAANEPDPLNSPAWKYMREAFIGSAKWTFDDNVKVSVPKYAENPMQVPVQIDATAISGVSKIVVFADLNPIQHILSYEPGIQLKPSLSVRIKVEQATPVRAAVLDSEGLWHVGGTWLDAAGGGCTAPSTGNASPYWEDHLGEIQSRLFSSIPSAPESVSSSVRFKFKIIHPMDTGLASNIPEFYIEQLQVRNANGDVLARMQLSQPVAENPVMTLDLNNSSEKTLLWMRDNNGNEFEKVM